MNDEALLSPKRIWKSLKLWCWLVAISGKDYPFWLFIVYSYRPYASYKAGKY